jgi:hypothetical protein
MALSIASRMEFFSDEITVFKKGEKHMHSNDIKSFSQVGNVFSASISASMKKVAYDVQVIDCKLTFYKILEVTTIIRFWSYKPQLLASCII